MTIQAEHFLWERDGDLGLVTLNRPGRDEPGVKLSHDGRRRLIAPAWKS